MDPDKTSAFKAIGQALLIDRATGDEWKNLGIIFCENNGWSWPGNSYVLYRDEDITDLENDLAQYEIELYKNVVIGSGYRTNCFGFNDYKDISDDCLEMDLEALKFCASIMDEIGIYWCGWPDAPAFTLFASEEQIWELKKRLKEPIAEWQRENGFKPRE